MHPMTRESGSGVTGPAVTAGKVAHQKMGSSQNGLQAASARWRAATADANRLGARDERGVEKDEESDNQPQPNQDWNPEAEEERQVKLRVQIAIGVVVMVRTGWCAGGSSKGVNAGIFRRMLQIVNVLQRPRAQRQKRQRQENGGEALHREKSAGGSDGCQAAGMNPQPGFHHVIFTTSVFSQRASRVQQACRWGGRFSATCPW